MSVKRPNRRERIAAIAARDEYERTHPAEPNEEDEYDEGYEDGAGIDGAELLDAYRRYGRRAL